MPASATLLRPMRDGVSASCVALPEGPWATIEEFLLQRFPNIAAGEWQQRLSRGDVTDERGAPVRAGQRYAAHGRLFYYRSLPPEPRIPFEERVLYRDAHLLVADKPHFLPVTPAGRYLQETLLVRLRRRFGLAEIAPMHRLDRETAGLVLFSLSAATRGLYQSLFQQRRIDKTYEAIAPLREGLVFPLVRRSRIVPADAFMQMHEAAGEPNSETAIELIARLGGGLGQFRLMPRTGRKHQLRVHMAALGLPILNDTIYPVHRGPGEAADHERPLQLLARAVAFVDPLTGQERRFASRLVLRGDPAGRVAAASA